MDGDLFLGKDDYNIKINLGGIIEKDCIIILGIFFWDRIGFKEFIWEIFYKYYDKIWRIFFWDNVGYK